MCPNGTHQGMGIWVEQGGGTSCNEQKMTRGQLPSLGLERAAWPDQEENFKDALASKEVAVKEGKGA